MPAFAYWPGTIPAGSRSTEIVSSLDIVPTAISLAGGSLPTDLIIDGRDASPLILTETGKSAHAFLPFYNEPVYGNASKEIFAARFGRYKAHFITSPGLGNGRWSWHGPSPKAYHDPPIVFDIDADPSEALPIPANDLPAGLIEEILLAKREYEASLAPIHINPDFGFQFALCCGVGCTPDNGTCICICKNVPLPHPMPRA